MSAAAAAQPTGPNGSHRSTNRSSSTISSEPKALGKITPSVAALIGGCGQGTLGGSLLTARNAIFFRPLTGIRTRSSLVTSIGEAAIQITRLPSNGAPHKKQAFNSQHLLFLSRGRDIYHRQGTAESRGGT